MAKAKTEQQPQEDDQAATELKFDSPTVDTATPAAAQQETNLDQIHATECVINSECTLTRGCRGRLRQTNAISGRVQIYCPKCHAFAAGTRPINGMVVTGGGKLFDRVSGK